MVVKVVPKKSKKKKQAQAAQAAQEVTRLGGALRYLGGLGGSAVGSLVGMGAGGAHVGNNIGAAISKWLGSGDYTVSSNSIVSRSLKGSSSIPAMHVNDQSVRIAHKEYLGEIKATGAFTVFGSYELNPGNRDTFPWLSNIAAQFQEYSFKGVVFHYVPSSGTAISGTNSALGTVMMQTSYRSTDEVPTSKMEILNEYWSCETVPSECMAHPIECNPKENPFNVQYVRNGPVPVGDSKLIYDLGVTHVATSGQQGTNTIGDLWVTYDVELKKPILASNVTNRFLYGIVLGFGTIDFTNYWGTAPVYPNYNSIRMEASGRSITFQKNMVGVWKLDLMLSATTTFGAGNDLGTTPSVTGCVIIPMTDGSTFARTNMSAGTSTLNRAFATFVIEVTDATVIPTITFPIPSVGTGSITNSWFTITQQTY